MRIAYRAGRDVEAAIRRIGRTEDAQFSPDGKCLALAGLTENRILLLYMETGYGEPPTVVLTDFTEIEAAALHFPHGLSWLDTHTLAVGNRYGEIAILALPAGRPASKVRLDPVRSIGGDLGDLVKTPGSLSAAPVGLGLVELLVCNNYVHHVSRHLLDKRHAYAVLSSEVLVREGLDVPDGVTHSSSADWIAISNHGLRSVFLYRNAAGLGAASKPDGMLRGIHYPHGICFGPDGRSLLVADAGSPYVHVFTTDDGSWHGERDPQTSIQVIDHESFRRGNRTLEEGGPKGLDLAPDGSIMVTSCEEQPLAFFDLSGMLPRSDAPPPQGGAAEAERAREALLRSIAGANTGLSEATAAIRRGQRVGGRDDAQQPLLADDGPSTLGQCGANEEPAPVAAPTPTLDSPILREGPDSVAHHDNGAAKCFMI